MENPLPLAGLGARSWAFLIDWHIRTIVAALIITWTISVSGNFTAEKFREAFNLSDYLLPLAIYFLYHPVLEIAMKGTSPGKKLAGLHIVSIDGSPATTLQLMMRNFFRLVDAIPVFYSFGVLWCFFSKEQIRLGDRLAKTRLVYVN